MQKSGHTARFASGAIGLFLYRFGSPVSVWMWTGIDRSPIPVPRSLFPFTCFLFLGTPANFLSESATEAVAVHFIPALRPTYCFLFPVSRFLLIRFLLSRFPPLQVAVKWYYYENEAHHPLAPDCTLSKLMQ